jgi:hypothetical protein
VQTARISEAATNRANWTGATMMNPPRRTRSSPVANELVRTDISGADNPCLAK